MQHEHKQMHAQTYVCAHVCMHTHKTEFSASKMEEKREETSSPVFGALNRLKKVYSTTTSERHRFKMHVNERNEILSSSFDMSWFLKLH